MVEYTNYGNEKETWHRMRTWKRWAEWEIILFRELYPITPAGDLAIRLGRTVKSIHNQAHLLGVKANGFYHRPSHWDWDDPNNSRFEQLSEAEKGYIAGIIDGEGTIRIAKQASPKPLITVAITNQPVIDWLQAKLGGSVYAIHYNHGKPNISYTWQLTTYTTVVNLLKILKPYLIIKKQAASEIINYALPKTSRSWQKQITLSEN